MNKIYYYNVGGLCFSANADMDHPALFNFCPFAVRKEEVKETIFSLGYIEQLPPISEEMNAVCHVCVNGTCWNFYYSTCYTYDIILCIEGEQCRIYRMQADSDWHCVRIDWKVQDEIDAQALNNILMLSYVAAAAPRSRVLLHRHVSVRQREREWHLLDIQVWAKVPMRVCGYVMYPDVR